MSDKHEALKLLGLESGASLETINAAYIGKKQELTDKQNSAPTPALAQKYAGLISKLDAAHEVLTSEGTPVDKQGRLASPLSQTKLNDLPGMAPEDITQLNFVSGDVLAGRYTVKELIGQGGMGAVYCAHDQNTDREIALKILLPSLLKHDSARQRFLSEAKISQQLSHPNIVNVYDVQNEGDLFFLTMELLEGQDLRQWLENLKAVNQPVPLEECKRIIGELCDALNYAHEYTVHRDIKPENIWLDQNGRVKLMDFGIARVQSASQRTQTGAAMGTAYYMAPEQLQGRELDARADIYAVGVMLYEMLTGQIPAGRFESAITLRKDIGKGLSQTIDKALAVNPDQRFANAGELKQAVQSGKSGKAPRTAHVSASPLALGGGPNKWVVAAVLLIALIGLGAIAGTGVWKDWVPASKEEIAREKAAVAKLQGEIKVIKQRLESARRSLDSDVRDAERSKSSELAALEHWQRLTEGGLFNSSQIPELEGELAVGESLLREESFAEAHAALTGVRDGYQGLYGKFGTAEKLHGAEQASKAAEARWRKRKQDYDLSDPEAVAAAAEAESHAREAQYAGSFEEALESWKDAQWQWEAAYKAMDGEVARIDGQRTADKQARLAAAKRKAEEAERQRIAQLMKKLDIKLVSIPGGSFRMGDGSGDAREKPVRTVTVTAFKMMAYEATFAQWDACVEAGGCTHKPDDKGWGRGKRPAIDVSYEDITEQFIPWLNKASGQRFRLPSEAEWEYAARAGSTTKYSWGNSIDCGKARYGYLSNECGKQRSTDPIGSFAANQWGLYDMHGNVGELVQDCWNDNYVGAPNDGSAWTRGDCGRRVARGGSWGTEPMSLRSANRYRGTASDRYTFNGFRLVQD